MYNENIIYTTLDSTHFQSISEFLKHQISTIPINYFSPPNTDILKKALSDDRGISIGAFDNDRLIGIRITYLPLLDKDNHGYDLGYTETELLDTAQFHGTLVDRSSRYHGIGNQLVKLNCDEIFKKKFSRILATVHPENFSSRRMLISNGFAERLKTIKYNDLPRIIFEKKCGK